MLIIYNNFNLLKYQQEVKKIKIKKFYHKRCPVNQLVNIIIKEKKKVDTKNRLIIIHKILEQYLKGSSLKQITHLI